MGWHDPGRTSGMLFAALPDARRAAMVLFVRQRTHLLVQRPGAAALPARSPSILRFVVAALCGCLLWQPLKGHGRPADAAGGGSSTFISSHPGPAPTAGRTLILSPSFAADAGEPSRGAPLPDALGPPSGVGINPYHHTDLSGSPDLLSGPAATSIRHRSCLALPPRRTAAAP